MPFLGREMGDEPDYSEEIAREIDDEIRRVIEEAHEMGARGAGGAHDKLHPLSALLIERETIDKDQFERLLAGESEENVFVDEQPVAGRGSGPRASRKPGRTPRPFRLPGARCSRRPSPSLPDRRSVSQNPRP